MAQSRDSTKLRREGYYGAYRGTIGSPITGINGTPTGDFEITVDGIAQTGMVAQIVHLAGGNDSLAGIHTYPKFGARCVVIFEQGDLRAPKVIGYTEAQQSSNVGNISPGDILMRTSNGVQLALDESLNSARLFQSDGFGLYANRAELRLQHKFYTLQSNGDFTREQFNGKVTKMYSSDGLALYTMSKFTLVDTDHLHKSDTRVDQVTGDWSMTSKNNIKLRASQLNGSASEEINFSARNDFAIMSKTFSSTQNSDIYIGSNVGDIQVAALAGDIIMAAGAVATAETGISSHAAQISVETKGTIEIDNHTTNTTWSVDGSITEDAKLGITETYGIEGQSTSSKGPINISTKLNFEIDATLNVTIKATLNVDIEATVAMTLKATASMTITSSAIMSMNAAIFTLTSPLMTLTPALPIQGVKVITILGPQFIIPFP